MLVSTANAGGSGDVQPGQKVCGLTQRVRQESSGGVSVLSRANAFNAVTNFCVQSHIGPGFTVLNNLPDRNSDVQAYPFTGVGCAYYLCSTNTDLPKKVRYLSPRINTSWTWYGDAPGFWNASYDIWFDKYNQISTQDDGAELMIWLRTMPGYNGGRWVYINRIGWMRLETWRACNNGTCWNYVQFRYPGTVHSVRNLPLWPFIHFCLYYHLIRWSWWLTSVHAGYEIWYGGKGLDTTWFNYHG